MLRVIALQKRRQAEQPKRRDRDEFQRARRLGGAARDVRFHRLDLVERLPATFRVFVARFG